MKYPYDQQGTKGSDGAITKGIGDPYLPNLHQFAAYSINDVCGPQDDSGEQKHSYKLQLSISIRFRPPQADFRTAAPYPTSSSALHSTQQRIDPRTLDPCWYEKRVTDV